MEKMNSIMTLQSSVLSHWTDKAQKRFYRIIMGYYIIIELGQQISSLQFLQNPILNNWILPAISTMILIFYYFVMPKVGIVGLERNKEVFLGGAFLFSSLLLTLRLMLGVILSSLGKSPYDHSLTAILSNIANLLPMCLFQEFVRVYGLCSCKKKNRWKTFWLLLILFTLTQVRYSEVVRLSGLKSILEYSFQTLVPLLMQQAICNLLGWLGGFLAVNIYILIPRIFEFIFPVLPNLQWFAEGVLTITFDSVVILYLISAVEKLSPTRKRVKKGSLASTSIVYGCCILSIWFFAGVFPVYPSIVLTGSMEPEIKPGDIVLIRKYSSEEEVKSAKVGDVINFDRDDINITHRIVEIIEEDGVRTAYRTKGDNNPAMDTRLVEFSEMNGQVVGCIPKAGLIVLWFRSDEAEETGREINGQ